MKTSNLLIPSVGVNLILVGALAYSMSRPAAPTPAPMPARTESPKPAAPRAERAAVAPPASGQFAWRQVESEDYKKYIANLRAIGCPEETIRDLIIADVNKFFSHKLDGLAARAREFKFWEAGASRSKINAENRRQIQALDHEKWALLRDLLGVDVESEFRKTVNPADYLNEELMLGYLTGEKRNRVRSIIDRFQALEQEITQRVPGNLQPKERAELKKLREQRQAELAGILTPQELEEFDLRTSGVADTLRARLAGFQPNEEQFRQMFRAQKAYDDEYGSGFSPLSAPNPEKRMQAQKQLEDQLKGVLGDQNYNEYKRAQDPSYRALVEVARDLGLPTDTAVKVYDIKKVVDEQVRQVLSDQSLPRDERMAALKTISAETEKALIQTMGQAAYDAYKENGGDWVPSVNGNTFVYSSTSNDGMAMRSFKISEAGSSGSGSGQTATQPGASVIVIPSGDGGSRVKIKNPASP